MTTPRILAVTQKFRAQLIAHEDKATHALNAGYQATLARINPALQRLYTQMVDALASGEQLPLSWLYEAQRLESLKRLVTNEISHYAALSQVTTQQLQHTGVQLGSQSAHSQLQASVPVGVHYAFGVPSQQAIANIVGVTQAGSPLRSLFDGFGAEAAKKVSDALITGVSMGRNPRAVARDVQSALGISRNRAVTIARQEMLRSYRSANMETFRANSDVVEQWRWTADLSPRTCAACIAMDGTLHDVSEDMASHVQCRCVPTPVTKSWDSILGPLGIDTSGLDNEL